MASAAYIDEADVDAMVGADVRTGLFTTADTVYSTAHFTRLVQLASALVRSAAKNAGYTLGTTTSDDFVKIATLIEFIVMAPANRKGLEIGKDFVDRYGTLHAAIAAGNLPLIDIDPDPAAGIGGVVWTSSDETDATGIAEGNVKPQTMKRLRLMM